MSTRRSAPSDADRNSDPRARLAGFAVGPRRSARQRQSDEPGQSARGEPSDQNGRDRQPRTTLRGDDASRARPRLRAAHAGRADGRPLWRRKPHHLERRIHQHRDRSDRHAYGRARPFGLSMRREGRQSNMLFYNGNRLSDMWSPYGLKKLGIENAPPFFTRGVLFDVQGLKGRVLDVGEEIKLADLKACLERQKHAGGCDHAGRRGVRADRPRVALAHRRSRTFYTAPRGSVSNVRVGSPTNRFASSGPIISPSTLCRLPTPKYFIPATSTSL